MIFQQFLVPSRQLFLLTNTLQCNEKFTIFMMYFSIVLFNVPLFSLFNIGLFDVPQFAQLDVALF